MKAALSLVEGRVDYMSACIVLSRATDLKVEMSDLWEGLQLGSVGGGGEEEVMLDGVAEQACIQVKAQFTWQEMQLAIHRSTTQHFFNIVEKMYDFIMQQKRRSERTLSTMLPAGSAASKALEAYRQEQARMAEEEEAKGECASVKALPAPYGIFSSREQPAPLAVGHQGWWKGIDAHPGNPAS